MTFQASFRNLPQFTRFLVCGGIAALVNWSSRFAWNMTMSFGAAVAAAYATGMIVAFLLFREFVFAKSEVEFSSQVQRFIFVNLVGMMATWALANFFALWALPRLGMTSHVEPTAHALAIATPVATSWFGHRQLTFR